MAVLPGQLSHCPNQVAAPGLFTNFEAACGSYDPFFFSNDLGHLAVNCMDYTQDPPTYQYYVYTTLNGGLNWNSSTYPGESLYFFSEGYRMGIWPGRSIAPPMVDSPGKPSRMSIGMLRWTSSVNTSVGELPGKLTSWRW